MKHKIAELEGALLDYAVALALGHRLSVSDMYGLEVLDAETGHLVERTNYSTEWAHGGPLLERMEISVAASENADGSVEWSAQAGPFGDYIDVTLPLGDMGSPTALIAACRAAVAWKFGDEVDLPDAAKARK